MWLSYNTIKVINMKDFSKYEIDKEIYFSGAEKKNQITVNGQRYIVKHQRNSEVGLIYNHISEYLGSHIFELLGIDVQHTELGVYHGANVVVVKNFCQGDEILVHFNDVGESSLEEDKEMYQYSYEDIQQMLNDNVKLTDVKESIERFWDMFIVDALNGNFDRHGGNWGFIKKENKYKIAPVFDNGSSMYPKLNTDKQLAEIMRSEEEIDKRIYAFPTSHIKLNGRKSSYFEVINSLQFEECNKALKRIVPKIELDTICKLVDSIENISHMRKEFYKTMYEQRYAKILKTAYDMLNE